MRILNQYQKEQNESEYTLADKKVLNILQYALTSYLTVIQNGKISSILYNDELDSVALEVNKMRKKLGKGPYNAENS